MIVVMTLRCPHCGLEYRGGISDRVPYYCSECGKELYTPEFKETLSVVEAARQKGIQIRMDHLESMAAAYFQKTDIPPDEVELVEEQGGFQTIWYFRRRRAN